MIRELLPLLPPEAENIPRSALLAIVLVGIALWAVGSRFSRSLLTLLFVAVGAVVGLQLPHWFGWSINEMVSCVAAALLLGMLAFILHGLWMRVAFAVLVGLWAVLAVWIVAGAADWSWPRVEGSAGIADYIRLIPEYLLVVWQQLPATHRSHLLWAIPASAGGAFTLAVFFPRTALVVFYSMLGLTVLTVAGLMHMAATGSTLGLPQRTWMQAAIVALLLFCGVMIQWRFLPGPPSAKTAKEPEAGEKKDDSTEKQ